jgi:predicted ATPase
LWAGPEIIGRAVRRGEYAVEGTVRKKSISLKLGFSGADYGYAIDLGLSPPAQPPAPPSPFLHDPEIKLEAMWHGDLLTRSSLAAERRGPLVKIRTEGNNFKNVIVNLATVDSMMTHCADPALGRDLLILRERMRNWRFYDHFRSDRDAPARRAQIGTFTPVLADDGADLASAVMTIREVGDGAALDQAVADAFPKAQVEVTTKDGLFELTMQQHGMLRPLRTAELSDGTFRYLLWVAALLSPRPPSLMVLNEPETSLHTDLIAPLGRLILEASKNMQVLVISHNQILIETLMTAGSVNHIALNKDFGETQLQGETEHVSWVWPAR